MVEAPENRAGHIMVSRVIRASVLAVLFLIKTRKGGRLPAVIASESAPSGSQLHGQNEGSSFKIYGRAGEERAHQKVTGKSTGAISEKITPVLPVRTGSLLSGTLSSCL